MNRRQHDDRIRPSRRAFLAQMVVAAAGIGAARCGSESPSRPLAADRRGGGGPPAGRRRPPIPAREPVMRVRVFRARGDGGSVRIGEPGQTLRARAADRAMDVAAPVRVATAKSGWALIEHGERAHAIAGREPLELEWREGGDAFLRLGERSYAGAMRFLARTDLDPGAFDVINLVLMEDYLPGVVAGELYDHWRFETRAAQAIAARSFAASEHANFRGRRDYDVSNTAASQVYLGRVRHRDSIEAVQHTHGVVLASGGLLVPGYYSACCGGTAARAVDVIGTHPANDVRPLDGRDGTDVCTQKKVARWTVTRPRTELTSRLQAYGRRRGEASLEALGRIARLEVVKANAHGRPLRYAIFDESGARAELDAEAFRSACNSSAPGMGSPEEILWSSHLELEAAGDLVTIAGRGYGHGVGLCQYGAETLARSGKAHQSIIEWYYPGAELVRAY